MRLPNSTEHISIIGQNGSGKTQLAAWVLSLANWTSRPAVIIDYKHEELFAQIDGVKPLGSFNGRPPWKRPRNAGLYIVQPHPWEKEEMEALLYSIWRKGNCIVYFDEAHMLPKQEDGAFQALLTQGRSKKIQLIVLTQRPAFVSRFVMSEAKFFSVFHLNDKRDRQTVASFVPIPWDYDLPQYHSYWFDVAKREKLHLSPVPARDTILDTFASRAPSPRGSYLWNAFTSPGPSKTGLRWS